MRTLLVASALALLACQPAASPTATPNATPTPTPTPNATPTPTPNATANATATANRMFLTPLPPVSSRIPFTLYKFLAEVGYERDTYVALPDGGLEAKAVFSYRDRMSTVPLAASVRFDASGALRRYAAWGKTSRFTVIDDHVDATSDGGFDVARDGDKRSTHVKPDGVAVVASGYAPVLTRDLMLRAWNQHGRPAKMALLPAGEVQIESRGKETYDGDSGKVTLEHVAIRGLVWGRDDAWLDDKGELAAVITRDAEFDHSEATREGFGALLPQLAKNTGVDGAKWLASVAKEAQRSAPGVLAFVGANLIDGTGRAPVKDAVVIVDGDRIVAAGARATVTIPAGAAVIDVTGKSIVPGLWDMHAHVEQVEQGAVYLAAGITTVRDMGNILDFITGMRDAIDSGNGLGPRVLVDGLVDGVGEGALGTIRIKTRADIAPTIDRLKKAGCLEVKIYSSIAPDLVRPIAAYAHAHGMRVVGHVPTGMTSQQAIDAGFDSISHAQYLFDAVRPKDAKNLSREAGLKVLAGLDLTAPAMQHLLASLASRHVFIDDTVALYEQFFYPPEEAAKREPGIATLPRELPSSLSSLPSELAAAGDAAFQKYVALLRELHEHRIPVVAGTDIAVPGHSLHREMEIYVQAGFTPMEALQAATVVPARVMHMEKELGTIEPGKRADLVVLDGDPLADVHDIRKTALVVARGRAYDSAALWRIAGFGRVK